MTSFSLPLVLHVQADDQDEARSLQETAVGLLATDPRLAGSVVAVDAPTPRERP